MSGPLLIVGASGRAAATSAIRAGFTPYVLDLFADVDTQRLAQTVKCDDYPHGFIELAKQLPPMPWMYTGGLENYPDVVAAISETRELFGNGPDVLKQVRDPAFLRASPETYLRVYPEGDSVERWMRKPKRGAAGHGVRLATPSDIANWHPNGDYYLQEYREGRPSSAVFHDGKFLGQTRQLIGEPWLHGTGFHYCGNITVPASPRIAELASIFSLIGPWGIDFIDDGRPWIVEINPRYPASYELVSRDAESAERSAGVATTIARRNDERSPRSAPEASASRLTISSVGKAIYYAPHRIVFPASGPWESCPDFADIPHAGDIIERGQPVFTLFAEGTTEEACLAELKRRAAEMDRLFAT